MNERKEHTMTEHFPLPAGHEDKSEGFARAYAHAQSKGNGEKASLQYAEAWSDDFDYDASEEAEVS